MKILNCYYLQQEFLWRSDLYKNSFFFVIAAVFAIAGNKRLICIGTYIFDINDTGCDHLNKRETFAQAGDPGISFFTVGISGNQAVATVARLQ